MNPTNALNVTHRGARQRDFAGMFVRGFTRAAAAVQEWRRLSRSRRELAALDESQLRDLGLSRSQALFEGDKSFLQH